MAPKKVKGKRTERNRVWVIEGFSADRPRAGWWPTGGEWYHSEERCERELANLLAGDWKDNHESYRVTEYRAIR